MLRRACWISFTTSSLCDHKLIPFLYYLPLMRIYRLKESISLLLDSRVVQSKVRRSGVMTPDSYILTCLNSSYISIKGRPLSLASWALLLHSHELPYEVRVSHSTFFDIGNQEHTELCGFGSVLQSKYGMPMSPWIRICWP